MHWGPVSANQPFVAPPAPLAANTLQNYKLARHTFQLPSRPPFRCMAYLNRLSHLRTLSPSPSSDSRHCSRRLVAS